MGIERFHESDEDPTRKAGADLPNDAGRAGGAGRSEGSTQSGDVARPEESAPGKSPHESLGRADAADKPAETRTRSEYADHIAPPDSPPIENDSPEHAAEDPDSISDGHGAAMPYGEGHINESHSAREPDWEQAEEHWDEERPHPGDDATAPKEERHSPGHPAVEPTRSENENTAPSGEDEDAHGNVETDVNLGLVREIDASQRGKAEGEPSTTDELEGPPPETPSAQESNRGENIDAEPAPSPEPHEESPGDGRLVTDDQNQDTSETDEQTHPLTDREWAEHLTEVRDGLDWARRNQLQTHKLHTIDRDNREWSAQRNRLQGEIVSEMYNRAKDVPCGQQAIIAGGLGGAGKTTVLTEHANIDLSNYLVVNPDDIKEEMARRGMIPQISGLSPMEASDLAHEESSYIAKRLAIRAMAEGKNLIWDITMSSEDSTKERINNLRSAGYDYIEGIFVQIPTETSIRRIDARHREGHDKYRAGVGLGGRFVPQEVVRSQEDPEWGSQNRRTFERVKSTVNAWSVYDNSVDGRAPIGIESRPR